MARRVRTVPLLYLAFVVAWALSPILIVVALAVGASIRNSIIANCPTTLRIGKNAVDAVAVDKTILGLGEVAVDGQKINQAGWPEFITTHKRLAGAVIDSPALEGPLFTLPADSPLLA